METQFLSGFTVTTEASGDSENDLDEQENKKHNHKSNV